MVGEQEELFVSAGLDVVAPAFASQHNMGDPQVFRCESGPQFVTGLDSSYRSAYNPCDSSLTSARSVGRAVVANTLLTVLSLGTNLVTASSVTFVDTDKDKVAKLVVDSKLMQCLKDANAKGLKNDFAVVAIEAAEIDNNQADAANKLKLEELGGGACGANTQTADPDTYYQRGKQLIVMNEYKDAMVCLMRAQEEEKDTSTNVYRDSCSQIATMYELGWGVDKDINIAKAWLKKAGL